MNILNVSNLCKKYPSFELNNVTFSLEEGKITGFIGRNGAGKSTTLNSLFHFVHPDSGEVTFWNKNIEDAELEIKQKVGFVSSGVNYYPKKKIKKITSITKTFYDNWEQDNYNKYMKMFKIDENKTPSELSTGMKIKYSIALALSHQADLLILDEPTSGLDPVSRDDLLDVFMDLCDEGRTILFSTHITSDLDKCADNIIYIKNGQILAQKERNEFVNDYRVVEYQKGDFSDDRHSLLIGEKRSKDGLSALVKTSDLAKLDVTGKVADIESIMIHLEKEELL